MTGPSRVFVGAGQFTAGSRSGIFRRVGAAGWEPLGTGLPATVQVMAITVHPDDPAVLYIGTQDGPYRSRDGGDTWQRLAFPESGLQVWSILVHPSDSRRLYAGTSPLGVFRSDDGGDSWRRLPNAVQPERVKMPFACRVMRMAADPARPDTLWAAVEVGGVMRSDDAGETWTDCSADLVKLAERPHLKSRIVSDTTAEGMLDGHAVAIDPAAPDAAIVALRMGLFRTEDGGRSWQDMEVGRFSPTTYGRDVKVSPTEPGTLYAALSVAASSHDGGLYRSADGGRSWTRFDKVQVHGTIMSIGLHPRDPAQVYLGARYDGEVFGTRDGGRTWQGMKLPGEVQHIYSVACG